MKSQIRLYAHALSLELRKVFSYRFDFWLNFILQIVVSLILAYFLWDSIFTSSQQEVIGGYNFKEMMFFYLLAPMIFKCANGVQMAVLAQEIYDGELNKYLLFPISFFIHKLMSHFSYVLVYMAQILVAVLAYDFIFGIPASLNFSYWNLLHAVPVILIGSYTYFTMAASLQYIAFWADHVWSLLVFMRFIAGILGGAMLPLALFPEKVRPLLEYLPFAKIVAFPIQVILGRTDLHTYMESVGILFIWAIVLTFASVKLWNRGIRSYTGVGI